MARGRRGGCGDSLPSGACATTGSRRATAWRAWAGSQVLVLHPTADFVDADGNAPFGLNNGSVAFSLQHGAVRVLFTGDVEQETDPAILAWGPRLQARLLKVAHHGSRTSSQPLFVAAVSPVVAVMSLGDGQQVQAPSPGGRRTLHSARGGACCAPITPARCACGLTARAWSCKR